MARHPFTPAWLAGEDRAVALLPRAFADPGAREAAVRDAAARCVHPAVLESLAGSTDAQRHNRDRLAQGAVCVVTGQQAGLFGGPLYTVYKAAAAVVNARALEAETGVPCVPVFWLQNEDHDFDEIAVCHVLGDDHALHTLRVPTDPEYEGVSVTFRPLEAEGALQGLRACLPQASEVHALMAEAYGKVAPADRGFRTWLEALFAEHGLLVLDPSTPEMQRAAEPLHREAWDRAEELGQVLQERVEALLAAEFRVQVHVRPRAPLSFVHPDGREGARYRVEPAGTGWRLCGTDRTVASSAVAGGPFSSSALLRPLVQDHLLPTAAYVGGPGEIAYFAQLPPLYEAFERRLPLVVPRARFRIVDAAWSRIAGQLGITADQLGRGRDALLVHLSPADDAPLAEAAMREALRNPVHEAIQGRAAAIAELDPSLARAVARTERTVGRAVERLIAKVQRARTLRDETTVARLDRLLAALHPHGSPQERVHAWPWYGARYGVSGFVHSVLGAVRPFDGTLVDLPLEPVP